MLQLNSPELQHLAPRIKTNARRYLKPLSSKHRGSWRDRASLIGCSMKALGCSVLLVLWACGGAQGKACDNPEIENGQLSSWYYRNYPNQYFPMTKGREIYYECFRGYATESGYGSGGITCSDEGWTPAPRCRRACKRPYFDNMDLYFNKDHYTEGQTVYFRCYPGFFTHEGQEAGTVECLSNGQFSQATCIRQLKFLEPSPDSSTTFGGLDEVPRYTAEEGTGHRMLSYVKRSDNLNGSRS